MRFDQMVHVLTKFEVARILGTRSLQLSQGSPPLIPMESQELRSNSLYVAALELERRLLKAIVVRGDEEIDVQEALFPENLQVLLFDIDGRKRR